MDTMYQNCKRLIEDEGKKRKLLFYFFLILFFVLCDGVWSSNNKLKNEVEYLNEKIYDLEQRMVENNLLKPTEFEKKHILNNIQRKGKENE
tara:strand:+ start:299 stop:571 length:273 start_codon:yes stop_codon:yes gene_type:complete